MHVASAALRICPRNYTLSRCSLTFQRPRVGHREHKGALPILFAGRWTRPPDDDYDGQVSRELPMMQLGGEHCRQGDEQWLREPTNPGTNTAEARSWSWFWEPALRLLL